MRPEKLTVTFYLLLLISTSYGQDGNPFNAIGKKAKIVTAYGNKFTETFDEVNVTRIGSILIDISSKKIVKILNADSLVTAAFDNTTSTRWYRPDPMAEKYYSQSPYQFALNDPILFNDPDGRDVDPTNLKGNGNVNALKNILSTKAGYKLIAQFMHKGGVINITVGGKTTTFKFNKEGARANDRLLLVSTPNSELNPEGHGDAGMPRDAVTSETEKNGNKEIGDDKNYDTKKGVSFNVFVEKELSEKESTSAMAHELTVHVDPNAQRLQQINNKITDGTLKPGTSEYLKQLQSIQNSGAQDHQNLGRGLNQNYLNLSAQLDKLYNTNQYTELYKKDVNANK